MQTLTAMYKWRNHSLHHKKSIVALLVFEQIDANFAVLNILRNTIQKCSLPPLTDPYANTDRKTRTDGQTDLIFRRFTSDLRLSDSYVLPVCMLVCPCLFRKCMYELNPGESCTSV